MNSLTEIATGIGRLLWRSFVCLGVLALIIGMAIALEDWETLWGRL